MSSPVDSLLAVAAGEQPPPHVAEGLRVGHVHLHVGDIDAGLAFYRDVVGRSRSRLSSAPACGAGGTG